MNDADKYVCSLCLDLYDNEEEAINCCNYKEGFFDKYIKWFLNKAQRFKKEFVKNHEK